MRFMGRVLPMGAKWKKWNDDAVVKTSAMIAAWRANQPFQIGEHYSHESAKNELWTIFGGKCSYCEERLQGAQFGDVEHYRPKSKVRDAENKVVVDAAGNPHRGYFWFAYDWFNLLLACAACNRVETSKTGTKHGKGERFPLEGGDRSFTPDDGVVEQPTLLNPWIDDPAEHLIFDASGTISWRTDRGRRNIELLGLNRDGLLESRTETCNYVRTLYVRMVTASLEGDITKFEKHVKELDEHRDGKKPFSATIAALLRELDAKLGATLNRRVA